MKKCSGIAQDNISQETHSTTAPPMSPFLAPSIFPAAPNKIVPGAPMKRTGPFS